MQIIRMLCLANSRKNRERCIAGINLDTGKWIRPVTQGGGALNFNHINNQYNNETQVLDVVKISLTGHVPLNFQPENYNINPDFTWNKQGEKSFDDLENYLCDSNNICNECIFFDTSSDSRACSDFNSPGDCKHSLALIQPNNFKVEKRDRSLYDDSPQIRAKFSFGGNNYDLAITDDKFENQYYEQGISCGYHELDNEVYLTISLGEEYEVYNRHYKLVAAVINE